MQDVVMQSRLCLLVTDLPVVRVPHTHFRNWKQERKLNFYAVNLVCRLAWLTAWVRGQDPTF